MLIEKAKYDFLLEESAKLGLAPWYINSTPEGVWAFALLDLKDIEWTERWLPITTDFTNKNNKMKMVWFISVDQGFKII